jgi:hypothetical protein
VRQKANYTILSETSSGESVDWTFDFKAGNYFLEGKGKAVIADGKFKELVIERR